MAVKSCQVNKLCFKVLTKPTILERPDVVDAQLVLTRPISGLMLGSFRQERITHNGSILSERAQYKYTGSTGTHVNFHPFLNKMRRCVLLPRNGFPIKFPGVLPGFRV